MLDGKQSGECKQPSSDGSSNLKKGHDEQEEIKNITDSYGISAWFIGPTVENEEEIHGNNRTRKDTNPNVTKKLLTDHSQRIVILYLHGSEGNRSAKFR